jgi:steroid delta-isomerase-like uncharacterized protein
MDRKTLLWTPLALGALALGAFVAPSDSADEALVKRYVNEVWNAASVQAAREILAEDFERYPAVPGTAVRGRAAFEGYLQKTHAAYPDFAVAIREIAKEGDRTILAWTASGTNTGTAPWKATGKAFEVDGTSSLRIAGGKIVQEFAGWDYVDGYRQIGVDPADATNARNAEIYVGAIDDLYNQGKLEVADAVYAKDYEFHVTEAGMGSRGPDEIKRRVAAFRTGFPDLRVVPEQTICEGDTVAVRATLTGTHRGEFLGVAPTGKPVTIQVLSMGRLVDGRIQESWATWDTGSLFRQLGVQPPAPK